MNPDRRLIFQILKGDFFYSVSSKGLADSLNQASKKEKKLFCFWRGKNAKKGYLEFNENNWDEVKLRVENKLFPALEDCSFLDGFSVEKFVAPKPAKEAPEDIPPSGIAICFNRDSVVKQNIKNRVENPILQSSIIFRTSGEALTVGNLLISSRKVGCAFPEKKEKLNLLFWSASFLLKTNAAQKVKNTLISKETQLLLWSLSMFLLYPE